VWLYFNHLITFAYSFLICTTGIIIYCSSELLYRSCEEKYVKAYYKLWWNMQMQTSPLVLQTYIPRLPPSVVPEIMVSTETYICSVAIVPELICPSTFMPWCLPCVNTLPIWSIKKSKGWNTMTPYDNQGGY
jgi:hypothetical protein